MPEAHIVLNAMNPEDAGAALTRCCGASRWVTSMLARRPWLSAAALHADADEIWRRLDGTDFREAFAQHPRIGGSDGDRDRDGWASQEQARVGEAGQEIRSALRAANDRYFQRFGYIFIVCATGRSAEELLALLQDRLDNEPARELAIAAAEQARITHLRLDKVGA